MPNCHHCQTPFEPKPRRNRHGVIGDAQPALARLDAGETQADIARSYGVEATTIGRLV